MGLLGDSWDDPKTQAALSLAAGLLSGGNFGQSLGRGLQGYQQSMSSAEEAAQRKEMMDWKRQEMRAAQEAAQRRQQFLGTLGQQLGGVTSQQALAAPSAGSPAQDDPGGQLTWPPQPATAKPGQVGPTVERAALIGQRAPVDWQQVMTDGMAAGFTPEQIKAVADAQNLGRQRVARVEETTDSQGRPVKRQFSEFGDVIGNDMGSYKEGKIVNFGQFQYLVDPVSGKRTLLGQNTMSPGEAASNAVARGQLALSGERLRFDKSQAGKPQFHDGAWVSPPSAQNPQGAAVPVPGMPQKPMTETQAKANVFGARAQEAQRIFEELAADPKNPIDGLTPWQKLTYGGNNVNAQRYEQAQRDFINAVLRKESGAAIGKDEFDNAIKQYFPRYGDTKEVIAQKARNRQLVIDGFAAEVPGGFRINRTQPGGASGGGWSAVEVR